MLKGLTKKHIKTMNNKMAIDTNLWTIDSKKQTKQTRTETESWIWRVFWWLPDGRGCGAEWV